MRHKRMFGLFLAIAACLTANPGSTKCQSVKLYQQMSLTERSAFVSEQVHRLAREMSGKQYQFTPAFKAAVLRNVESYTSRIGNDVAPPDAGDLRLMFERGQMVAVTLNKIFKARNVSPLIGLYLPAIESEYINIQSPNQAGALGMFQFLPKTGEAFGLSEMDLLDVEKSADAAARYIAEAMNRFRGDPMKEALAILSYTRGVPNVRRDLESINPENATCSICVLSDRQIMLRRQPVNGENPAPSQNEGAGFVPRFFAAAIIGENPQAFGLPTQPLSSF